MKIELRGRLQPHSGRECCHSVDLSNSSCTFIYLKSSDIEMGTDVLCFAVLQVVGEMPYGWIIRQMKTCSCSHDYLL